MTTTEAPSTTPEAADSGSPTPVTTRPSGVAGLLGTGDHASIGRVFIGAALALGAASAVALGLGMLGTLAGGGPFSADVSLRLSSAGQLGLVFGFALPLFLGFALVVVPLQVGAATIAFPRAAATGLWVWLAGAATLVVAYAIDGGIGGTTPRAVDLAMLAVAMTVTGLLVTSVSVATTVVALRAPGMTLDRVPLFAWSMLVASGIWLLSWPVLLGNLLLVRTDIVNGSVAFAGPGEQWAMLSWSFVLPQVYAVAIPVLGVAGDALVTAAGRRQVHRGVVLGAMGAFGILSLGSWAQAWQDGNVWREALFVVVSFAIVLPVVAFAGGVATTLREGRPRFSVPLAGGLAAMVVLLVATVVGALYAIGPLDLTVLVAANGQLPVAAIGHAGLVLGAVGVGAALAAAYWASKVSGGEAPAVVSLAAIGTAVAGGFLWGLALVVAGLSTLATGLAGAVDALVVIAMVGALVLALSLVLSGLSLLGALRSAGDVPADPWGSGQTLEWLSPSPPEQANAWIGDLAPVASAEPLYDLPGGDPVSGGTQAGEGDAS